MMCAMVTGRGPVKKPRNTFLKLAGLAASFLLSFPVAAQSIVVTDSANEGRATELAPLAATEAPRSITTPFKPSGPRAPANLRLLIEEQKAPEMASTEEPAMTDTAVASVQRRPLPTITVSNLSVRPTLISKELP